MIHFLTQVEHWFTTAEHWRGVDGIPHRTLQHVVSSARVLKGARGEAEDVAALLLRRCMPGDGAAG